MNDEDEEEEEEEEEEEYNDYHLVILDFRVDGWYADHDVLKIKYWRGRPYSCRKPMAQGDRGGLNLGLPGAWLESFRVSNGAGGCLFLAKAKATSASTS